MFFKRVNKFIECFFFRHNFDIICVSWYDTILRIGAGNCEDFWLFNFWNFDIIDDLWFFVDELFGFDDVSLSFFIGDFNIQNCWVGSLDFINIDNTFNLCNGELFNIGSDDSLNFLFSDFFSGKFDELYWFRNNFYLFFKDSLNINNNWIWFVGFINYCNLSLFGWFLALEQNNYLLWGILNIRFHNLNSFYLFGLDWWDTLLDFRNDFVEILIDFENLFNAVCDNCSLSLESFSLID